MAGVLLAGAVAWFVPHIWPKAPEARRWWAALFTLLSPAFVWNVLVTTDTFGVFTHDRDGEPAGVGRAFSKPLKINNKRPPRKAFGHRYRDRPVCFDDGSWLVAHQLPVEHRDLGPVGRVGTGGGAVASGDRGL